MTKDEKEKRFNREFTQMYLHLAAQSWERARDRSEGGFTPWLLPEEVKNERT